MGCSCADPPGGILCLVQTPFLQRHWTVHGHRFLTFLLPHDIGSEVEKIVHWMPELLFVSEIMLRRLHRNIAEQELNLLQFTVAIAGTEAELLAPLARLIPAASSALSKPASAASRARRRTAASCWLRCSRPDATIRDTSDKRTTTMRLKANRGSEQCQAMN